MITRLGRLEAGQDRIAAAILEMQQQSQTCDQIRGPRRRSLRPCYARVRSAFVGAKGHLLRRTRCWWRNWAVACIFLKDATGWRVLARLAESDTRRNHCERYVGQAAEARRLADLADEAARCMIEWLKNGGDIDPVVDEFARAHIRCCDTWNWTFRDSGGSFGR